jgi:hypothetical protein
MQVNRKGIRGLACATGGGVGGSLCEERREVGVDVGVDEVWGKRGTKGLDSIVQELCEVLGIKGFTPKWWRTCNSTSRRRDVGCSYFRCRRGVRNCWVRKEPA